MKTSHFKRRLASYLHKISKFLLIALGLILLGVIYYLLATAGPRRITDDLPKTDNVNDPALTELSQQVDDLEKQYQQVAAAGLQTPEALAALENAVEKQRELVRRLPLSSYEQASRLRQLEIKRDSARAKDSLTRIAQLEREGTAAAERGDSTQALADLTEALRLQREINGTQAATQYKNYLRETSLATAIAAIEVAPINKQKEAALENYRAALKEKRWQDALTSLTAARDLQAKINYDSPRTRYTDIQALEKLDGEIASLNATDAIIEVEKLEKAAAEAELIADYPKAADLYAQAAARQREINTAYPRSRFVSSPRVEEFETKQQTALSRDIDHQLTALEPTIAEALSRRHVVVAQEQLATAIALIEKLETAYPRSRLQNPARKLKLAYLNVKKVSLSDLQDAVYTRIALVPGLATLQFGSTEVTQHLYEQVMNTNPSRNRVAGSTLPVESVSWNEAIEFCSRLSWIMGVKVRLPTEAEYLAALKGGPGGIRAKDSSPPSTGEAGSLASNDYGIHDLLGNVAEWLASSADDKDATHIGGSYLDAPETLTPAAPPKGRLPKNERSRHIGFRIVIDAPAITGTIAAIKAAKKAAVEIENHDETELEP
ncbi:SUMF1/EgtB/PvdO family nonheme iron enzyme [Geminisphaera colitermitum]|uniref:SUMF1/EgtB/PvdO family nonheme iron enzyme n=1 Tax=Geminisphaera colitermitum TaxID=1148786 RepID=UPI00019652FA|nr:SUMF1/EgtB/PvdO family nonheme iron enzyme [Geminisphaera colitermitum]